MQEVSIRYIAVLGSQPLNVDASFSPEEERFHPLYRGTWFPTIMFGNNVRMPLESFHPLYRGTWFPTLPEKHPL